MTKKSLLVSLAALGLALTAPLGAQTPAAPALQFPAASPGGTLKQRVGLTDVELTYNRPSAKGRKVFGGLVPYGEVWRTGADTATRLKVSTPVKLGGQALAAGTYELFTIPGASEWTVILQAAPEKASWGAYAYDAKKDTARFTVKPAATAAPVETLSFQIGQLSQGGATLWLSWENTKLSLPLEVDTVGTLVPQIEAAMANPETAKKIYFPSAMFYYENNLDLKKALEWINAGLAANDSAFWMIYRKGLILEKLGDKAAAKAAAEQSLALAEQDKRESLRKEYVALNRALLERVK